MKPDAFLNRSMVKPPTDFSGAQSLPWCTGYCSPANSSTSKRSKKDTLEHLADVKGCYAVILGHNYTFLQVIHPDASQNLVLYKQWLQCLFLARIWLDIYSILAAMLWYFPIMQHYSISSNEFVIRFHINTENTNHLDLYKEISSQHWGCRVSLFVFWEYRPGSWQGPQDCHPRVSLGFYIEKTDGIWGVWMSPLVLQ